MRDLSTYLEYIKHYEFRDVNTNLKHHPMLSH